MLGVSHVVSSSVFFSEVYIPGSTGRAHRKAAEGPCWLKETFRKSVGQWWRLTHAELLVSQPQCQLVAPTAIYHTWTRGVDLGFRALSPIFDIAEQDIRGVQQPADDGTCWATRKRGGRLTHWTDIAGSKQQALWSRH